MIGGPLPRRPKMTELPDPSARSPLDRLRWLDAVQRDRRLRSCATAVAAVLAACCNSSTGIAFPSLRTVADRSKWSKTSVKAAIKELQGAGWISIQAVRDEAGNRLSNRYRLLVHAGAWPEAAPGRAAADPPGTAHAPGGATQAQEARQPAPTPGAPPGPIPESLTQYSTAPEPWRQMLAAMAGERAYRLTLAALTLDHIRDETAFLTAPTPFARHFALTHHETAIRKAIAAIHPEVRMVRISTRSAS